MESTREAGIGGLPPIPCYQNLMFSWIGPILKSRSQGLEGINSLLYDCSVVWPEGLAPLFCPQPRDGGLCRRLSCSSRRGRMPERFTPPHAYPFLHPAAPARTSVPFTTARAEYSQQPFALPDPAAGRVLLLLLVWHCDIRPVPDTTMSLPSRTVL